MEIVNTRKDWLVEKLGKFAFHEKGRKPRNQKDISDETFKYVYVDIEAFEKKVFKSYTDGVQCNICSEQDFLMVWDGSRSGLVGKGIKGALGSTLVRINFPGIENDFAYFFLKSKYQQINTRAKGTGTPHVDPGLLWNYNFPIAPLPEQRAIVAKIEQLFSELDNGIRNFKAAQEQLKTYRQAVLKKAFEGELTKDWRAKQTNLPNAEELLQQIKEEREKHYQQQLQNWKQAVKDWEANGKIGKAPNRISKPKTLQGVTDEEKDVYGELPIKWHWSRFCNTTYKIGDIDHKMPKVFEGGLPYLSTGNLRKNGTIDFANAKTISKEDFDRLALKIKPERGDIIFPRYGTIGRNILINFDKEFLVSYACAIIKNITSIMDEKYIYYYSLSPVIKKEIKRYIVETTQANIGIASIESFVFPLCTTEEQHQIVQEIESRLSVCDKLKESIQESLLKAEVLRQSILKQAFEGSLLSEAELAASKQEADWEPAEVLLNRIKKEKTNSLKTLKVKTRIQKDKSGISQTDKHAAIICKIIQTHMDNPKYISKLGHVKCEKIVHLAEYHLGIDVGRNPFRDAAGPDDFPKLKKVESRATKANFFQIETRSIGYSYKLGQQANSLIDKFESGISKEQLKRLDSLISEFLRFNKEDAEIPATLYAAWNDLLIEGKTPSDEQIINEARENWSKAKLKIPTKRFSDALIWIRAMGYIPKGKGKKIIQRSEKTRNEHRKS